MDRLKGKVAIITGAANGMGLAGAKMYLREGAKVVALDMAKEKLDAEFPEGTPNVLTFACDITSRETWEKVVKETVEKFGKIDILVNNAGAHSPLNIFEESNEGWERVFNVNMKAIWLACREVIPVMQKNGGGSIVNTSSATAVVAGTVVDLGAAAYTASKGAVCAFTRHIAQHFGKDRIRCNSVLPGPIFTPMAAAAGFESAEAFGEAFNPNVTLPPHVGTTDDIAYAYVFLGSDESSFITGIDLCVDGGLASSDGGREKTY